MKKLLLILLTALLIFSLSACDLFSGGSGSSGAGTDESDEFALPPEPEVPSASSSDSNEPAGESTAASVSGDTSSTVSADSSSSESESESEGPPLTQRLVVPEGTTLAKVGMILEEMDVCTVEAFILAAQEGVYTEYPLVAAQVYDDNRCFKLEGYLYPDTYEIYSDETPDSIISRMLANNEKKYTAEIRRKISESGYTVDEIIALASIIEKESFGYEQMPNVSSVLHNRLEAKMQLQCDVTITYLTGVIEHFVPNGVERYKEYYNTYRCPALPAGAICNPSIQAVAAALNPAVTNYYYFLTDEDKNFYFAETLEEHEKNGIEAGIMTANSSEE
ncbi:MAG: endolytic transglycosylase MltG [Oscillospiraceae bacterium]